MRKPALFVPVVLAGQEFQKRSVNQQVSVLILFRKTERSIERWNEGTFQSVLPLSKGFHDAVLRTRFGIFNVFSRM